jgi:hypothetical protein
VISYFDYKDIFAGLEEGMDLMIPQIACYPHLNLCFVVDTFCQFEIILDKHPISLVGIKKFFASELGSAE